MASRRAPPEELPADEPAGVASNGQDMKNLQDGVQAMGIQSHPTPPFLMDRISLVLSGLPFIAPVFREQHAERLAERQKIQRILNRLSCNYQTPPPIITALCTLARICKIFVGQNRPLRLTLPILPENADIKADGYAKYASDFISSIVQQIATDFPPREGDPQRLDCIDYFASDEFIDRIWIGYGELWCLFLDSSAKIAEEYPAAPLPGTC